MTAAVSPPRSVRLTRRPTADPPTPLSSARNGRVTTGPDGIRPPPRPPGVRDRGHRPSRSEARERRQRRSGGTPRLWGPQPCGGPRRASGRAGKRRSRDAAARPRGGQIQGEGPPLQPVEQPRQLIGAPAATSSPIRAPDSRTGPVRTPRRRTARPASAGSSSTSKAIPVSRRSGALPPVAHPARPRTAGREPRRRRPEPRRRRPERRRATNGGTGGRNSCPMNCRTASRVTRPHSLRNALCASRHFMRPKWGRSGVFSGARVFARS